MKTENDESSEKVETLTEEELVAANALIPKSNIFDKNDDDDLFGDMFTFQAKPEKKI